MTEVQKRVKKSAQNNPRNEIAEPTQKKSAAPKTTAKTKKSVQSDATKSRNSAKKSQVEPGIGMIDCSSQKKSNATTAKNSASKKQTSKNVSSKTNSKTRQTTEIPIKRAPQTQAKANSQKRTSTGTAANTRRKTTNQAQALLYIENSNGKDPYDLFLDAAQRPVRKKKKKKQSALTVVLSLCIACVALLGVGQYAGYRSFCTMRDAVNRETFYEGTVVDGIDVSLMTLDQAKQHWAQSVEPVYSQRKVTLSNGTELTAAELGYTSDYEMVLNNAWNAGRSGSLEERYRALSTRRQQPVSYSVTRSNYDEESVDACVHAVAEQINRDAEDAKIASFDAETYSFTFTEAVAGSQLDTVALKTDIIQALENGGGNVELVVRTVQPQVTEEEVAAQYGMITYAVTNASSSSSNRLSNIKLALSLIDGYKLAPGETFSFNETVGQRTTERGFKVATAYSSGEVTQDVGGGICQVSTTLFNAAVKADMEIVERHNHSLTVSYVDKGKDASVNWDSQDLRFTNTSDDDIYICCLLTDDKRVRIGMFGKLLDNGETITVEAETTGRIDYETEYVANMLLPTGTTNVKQAGKSGYTATAYKIRWDKDGKQISKEVLCKSTYRATKEIIEYGP